MKKTNVNKRIKIIITIVTIIVLGFGIYCALWFIHYNTLIKPMIQNENLVLSISKDDDGLTHKTYTYYDQNDVLFDVFVPNFLKFQGNISVLTPTDYDENWVCTTDFSYGFHYKPYLFGDSKYRFTVHDYTEVKSINDSCISYNITTDADLNLISEDKEGLYDEHYDEIKELYDMSVEFFGDDAFKD